jgi:hypothetical protein
MVTTTAGALLGGNLSLTISDPSGSLTADDRARIADAVAVVDATLAPYGVAITQVGDADPSADVTLDTGATSGVGGLADGVLGCETGGDEVTLIQGWNWYAGADSGGIGPGQYDLETVVVHELGHVLGLGHSADTGSVMSATLSAGTAKRALATADLDVPDDDSGPCALHTAISTPAMASGGSVFLVGLPIAPSVVFSEPTGAPVALRLPRTPIRFVTRDWLWKPVRSRFDARMARQALHEGVVDTLLGAGSEARFGPVIAGASTGRHGPAAAVITGPLASLDTRPRPRT